MEIAVLVVVGVGGVVALVAAIVWATRAGVRRVAARSAAEIDAQFDGAAIQLRDPMANYFGLESKGGKQVRGNGGLVATADELWFRRFGADEPLVISRADIIETSVVRSHAGKSVGRPLVRVAFKGPGGADAVAWHVADASAWADLLSPG